MTITESPGQLAALALLPVAANQGHQAGPHEAAVSKPPPLCCRQNRRACAPSPTLGGMRNRKEKQGCGGWGQEDVDVDVWSTRPARQP